MRPGRIIKQVLSSAFKKPNTLNYPKEKTEMPAGYRGKLKYYPERCINCKMCMRNCPSEAIVITEVSPKKYQAQINLGRCLYCAQCVYSCPKEALEATKEFELAQTDPAKLKIVFKNEEPPKEAEKSP